MFRVQYVIPKEEWTLLYTIYTTYETVFSKKIVWINPYFSYSDSVYTSIIHLLSI